MLGGQAPEEEKMEISMVFKLLTTSKIATPKNEGGFQKTIKYPVQTHNGYTVPQGARAGKVGVGCKNQLLGKGLV